MPEDVVINVRQTSTGSALSDTEAKIAALKAQLAELNRLEKSYSTSNPTAAASVRTERLPVARELRDLQREQRSAQKLADTEATRATRDRAADERAITQEHREREAVTKARDSWMRRAGVTAGGAAAAFAGAMVEDYLLRQQIGLRDQHARASYDRARELHTTRGYSAGEAVADEGGLEGDIFERGQNRPLLQQQAKSGAVTGGLQGAAAGFASGAFIGSIIPGLGTAIGAGIGAVVGGAAGAYRGHMSGKRALEESDTEQVRDKEELAKRHEETKRRVATEISPAIKAQEALNAGHAQESRAIGDKLTRQLEYQRLLKATLGDEALAAEGADTALATIHRERAGAFAKLVTARDGAGDTARVAQAAIDQRNGVSALHETVKEQGRAAADAAWHKKFSTL